MGLKGRCSVAVLIICALLLELYIGWISADEMERERMRFAPDKDTIVLWYTDDALTDYLNSAALSFYESTDVHVETQLVSGLEYLEQINSASIKGGSAPDLYIVGNDSLGKAYLSGLATEVRDESQILTTDRYCQSALDAVTYNGKRVGYPMYFETSYLLYNETYLEQLAVAEIQAEWDEAAAEAQAQESADADAESADTETADTETSDAEIADEDARNQELLAAAKERAQEMVPATIDDIMNFADEYDAPENVESIFKWDVSDIFYNYFFVGNYVNIGGAAGDNANTIDIYNENAIRCLNLYQDLNQFFSIEADSVSYSSVLQEFIEGKILYTVVTTDAIATLEQAQADGSFAYEYGVAIIPNVTDELLSKEVSVTSAIAINSYSEHKVAANAFARMICSDYAGSLYTRTGKVSANQNVEYENEAISVIMQEYALSIPMPKIVETSNFWVELEMCFTNVWRGDDANATLKRLSESIMKQVTGEEYTEETIVVPVEEEEEYEDEGME